MQTKCCVAIGLCLVHDTLTKKCHIFRQGVISFLKSERFTVDLDEKLGDSLLEWVQLKFPVDEFQLCPQGSSQQIVMTQQNVR